MMLERNLIKQVRKEGSNLSPRMGLDINTILQAATDIANRDGWDAVTLASLAKKLNVRSPSLYNHVDGLPDIRKKLTLSGMEELYSAMERSVVNTTNDGVVRNLAHTYVSFARKNPGLYEATLRVPDPTDIEILEAGKRIVELALRVLEPYGLEDEAALHAVRGLRSILHGFSSLEQSGGFGLTLDLEISFNLLIDTFLAGIHKMKQRS